MNGKSAALLIIGNEILSGKVKDENAPYLTTELRALGVSVDRITTIPDDVETIAEEIRMSRKHDYLTFVCGGIGPTHDDVTMAGIAKGVGRPLIQHPKLLALLKETYRSNLNKVRLKMAEVPDGTELIFSEVLRVPVIHFEQVYIFPGIPELVVKKFEAIKEQFRETPFYLSKIYLNHGEGEIAEDLTKTLERYPELLLGSYPIRQPSAYKTLLTLESKEKTYLEAALQCLIDLLPDDAMVQTP